MSPPAACCGTAGWWQRRIEVTERWSRTSLRIGRDRLHPGLNRLTLRWPPADEDGEAALHAAVERLERGIAADLHPVFGEVFSLVARLLY
jgi:hypothetical protein